MLLLLLLHSSHRVDEHGEVAVLHLWRGVRLSHNGKVEVATRLIMTVINKNDSKRGSGIDARILHQVWCIVVDANNVLYIINVLIAASNCHRRRLNNN